MFQGRPGLMSLLKEGGKHYTGLEEAVYKNIEACKILGQVSSTSLGPHCMNKLVVSHIDKLFVTSDASTIVEQLEVQHPAAKIVALAAKMQDQQFGDNTNLVVILAGELLSLAEGLLREGLHTSDVIRGYSAASEYAVGLLESIALEANKTIDLTDFSQLKKAVATVIGTKALQGQEELLASLVCEAVGPSLTRGGSLNLDNIRVTKVVGGCVDQSVVIPGMALLRDAVGEVKSKEKTKVMVLGCGLENTSTEAKGTVLLQNAGELLNYTTGEEQRMENVIRGIADSGVGALIVGGNVADIALHYCNKMDILVVKVQSKYELQRLSRTLGAPVLLKVAPPSAPEQCGYAESIIVQEIASKPVTVIRSEDSKVSTIVLRAATNSLLDELERAISDGVRCVKNCQGDGRMVPGGGAIEIRLSQGVAQWASTLEGLQQYAAAKFALAFEVVPRLLAENAGLFGCEIVASLHAAHTNGTMSGVDGSSRSSGIADMVSKGIFDHLATKMCAVKLAADAALNVLYVDHIIMSRPAGGPKAPQTRGDWDED